MRGEPLAGWHTGLSSTYVYTVFEDPTESGAEVAPKACIFSPVDGASVCERVPTPDRALRARAHRQECLCHMASAE